MRTSRRQFLRLTLAASAAAALGGEADAQAPLPPTPACDADRIHHIPRAGIPTQLQHVMRTVPIHSALSYPLSTGQY